MFEAKGDRPQWRTVYEKISTLTIGDIVTYEELRALLPGSPEESVRNAFYRAMQECETQISRTFTNVRTVGYQMVHAREHERLARGHHKRAKGQLQRAHRKVSSADRVLLSREERARIDALEVNLAQQMEITRRLEARQNQLRSVVVNQGADTALLSERVNNLAQLLERHGITDRADAA